LITLLLSIALLTAAAGASATAGTAEQGISVEIHHVLLEGRESGSVKVKDIPACGVH